MKASKLTYLLAISLAFTFVATGCRKKPTNVTQLPGRVAQAPQDPTPGGIARPGEGSEGTPGFVEQPKDINPDQMHNDRAKFAAETVHFAYDSTAIAGHEKAKIATVASFMKSAPAGVALLVEGHCDERGTEEYNRALGERRALAVREALIAAGADGQRIVTRSYGKDRKIDTGASEASHARNRRGEFVVLTPK